MQVSFFGLPVGPVASFDLDDGRFRTEFIGIGTGLQPALKALGGMED